MPVRAKHCVKRAQPASDFEEIDDDELENAVSIEQLAGLCDQCRIASQGTKRELIQRLRDHATMEASKERARILARAARVQEGSDDAKERYEIMSEEPDDDDVDDDGFFFFDIPSTSPTISNAKSSATSNDTHKPMATRLSRDSVISPPPPNEVNDSGERVVTVYSTTETNDLTAISAAQPGRAMSSMDALSAGAATAISGSSLASQPWDIEKQQQTSETSSRQMEQAKETLTELVATLLALAGAPGFASADDDDDDDTDMSLDAFRTRKRTSVAFVGFNPASVPTDLLTASSQALRTGRGQVLSDVLRQFELQAIGFDGMAGDNTSRGGGHYREVSKVRAFLEGFRRAEVRRFARETTTLLLEKLMVEGVEGLDLTLNTMIRSSDDTEDYAGALNDSLLDFLNDSIREQEKKVSELIASRQLASGTEQGALLMDEVDPVESLWNVTMENGHRVETLDPNDPMVRSVLEAEVSKSRKFSTQIPDSAPEKLLLLLKLLRERVKAEAAFAPDEKGRNLRLLAYCLRVDSDEERRQLILRDLGSSLDVSSILAALPWIISIVDPFQESSHDFCFPLVQRLDSFMELVASSIEYGTSTSYELQPAKNQILDVQQLQGILDLAKGLRYRNGIKSLGVQP
jgi:hypothetical protein